MPARRGLCSFADAARCVAEQICRPVGAGSAITGEHCQLAIRGSSNANRRMPELPQEAARAAGAQRSHRQVRGLREVVCVAIPRQGRAGDFDEDGGQPIGAAHRSIEINDFLSHAPRAAAGAGSARVTPARVALVCWVCSRRAKGQVAPEAQKKKAASRGLAAVPGRPRIASGSRALPPGIVWPERPQTRPKIVACRAIRARMGGAL